ncbi:MAG: hypothetical protein GX648_07140 [Crenarchaeota archaeon]|nr:hypothetical protein [Thermoproteota archaeon]
MANKNKAMKRYCDSAQETEKLLQYWRRFGGLVFTEFNTTHGYGGKMRRLDAIRFPELESRVHKTADRYEEIRELVGKHAVELIEVHNWGFYGFGQLVGKAEIFRKYWSPKNMKLIFIVMGAHEFDPVTNPDPLTEDVFRKYGIEIFVPKN